MGTDGTSPASAEKSIPHVISIQIHPTTPPDGIKHRRKQSNKIRQIKRIYTRGSAPLYIFHQMLQLIIYMMLTMLCKPMHQKYHAQFVHAQTMC